MDIDKRIQQLQIELQKETNNVAAYEKNIRLFQAKIDSSNARINNLIGKVEENKFFAQELKKVKKE